MHINPTNGSGAPHLADDKPGDNNISLSKAVTFHTLASTLMEAREAHVSLWHRTIQQYSHGITAG